MGASGVHDLPADLSPPAAGFGGLRGLGTAPNWGEDFRPYVGQILKITPLVALCVHYECTGGVLPSQARQLSHLSPRPWLARRPEASLPPSFKTHPYLCKTLRNGRLVQKQPSAGASLRRQGGVQGGVG